MAELILPLTRTLFLPGGCPGLGSVEAVSGDLRDVRCGSSEGEAYCMGEADILVEYTAPLRPAGLFGEECGRPGSWQALLSFPFQLCGAGELPRDYACRVELGPLNWTMVASRAIELETTVCISYDLPEEETPHRADAPAEAGVIYRGRQKKEQESEGEWRMVSLMDEKKDEGGREKPLEIIDLSGGAEPRKIRQALAEALSRQDENGAEEGPATEEEYRISLSLKEEDQIKEDSAKCQPPVEQEESIIQEPPVKELQSEGSTPPEKEAPPLPTAKISFDEPVQEDTDPTPMRGTPDFAPDLPLPVPVSAPDSEPKVTEAAPVEEATEVAAIIAEPEETAVDKAAEATAIIEEPQAELLPEIQPEVRPEPRPKRRFRGLPGLHVEAYDNDIDVTAFHISIKL